mmetsp:Transcript_18468/g.62118  ORF Transcript_18468/g.62118 Transcript_18468/m.62118 type:complete len:242 (+) Transcript_18468:2921-3646(+)
MRQQQRDRRLGCARGVTPLLPFCHGPRGAAAPSAELSRIAFAAAVAAARCPSNGGAGRRRPSCRRRWWWWWRSRWGVRHRRGDVAWKRVAAGLLRGDKRRRRGVVRSWRVRLVEHSGAPCPLLRRLCRPLPPLRLVSVRHLLPLGGRLLLVQPLRPPPPRPGARLPLSRGAALRPEGRPGWNCFLGGGRGGGVPPPLCVGPRLALPHAARLFAAARLGGRPAAAYQHQWWRQRQWCSQQRQ